MASILFAWQLGEGYGHATPFLSIAARLRESGHRLVSAVPDPAALAGLGKLLGERVLRAPPLTLRGRLDPPPGSYAQLLAIHGFDDAGVLREQVRDWRRLFDQTRAELLIANHAPGALLAARAAGVPVVHLGTGFAVAPPTPLTPRLVSLMRVSPQAIATSEGAVNAALRACGDGGTGPANLGELYGRGTALIYSVPELDPFRDLREECIYLGPRYAAGLARPARWAPGPGPHLFGYLRPETPDLARLCERLRAAPGQALLHIPRLNHAQRASLQGNALRVSPAPIDLRTLGPACTLVLTNGSHGVCLEALLAGLPVLTLPTDQEKLMYARCIQEQGLGLTALPALHPPDWDPLLARLRGDGDLRGRVEAFAQRYATLTELEGTRRAVAAIAQALGDTPEV